MAKLNYTPIEPLKDVDFESSDKKLLREFFKWFVAEIPNRLAELQRAIDSTGGQKLSLDFSRESLPLLGQWFSKVGEMRQLTKSEIAEWKSKIPIGWDIPTIDMTNQTKFLGIDVGIYVAETLRHHYPFLKWFLVEKGKTMADYGRPVLTGFPHRLRFDPIGIGMVLAGKIAKNPALVSEVQRVFDVWSKDAKAAQQLEPRSKL